jgi:hypothetical protein
VCLLVPTLRTEIGYSFEKKKDWKSVAGRVGPVLILLEGIFFIIEGVISILFPVIYSFIPYFILMGGIVAILGIYLGYRRNKYARIVCFIAGILALVILISWDLTFRQMRYYITYILAILHIFYFDYVMLTLFFIGGILCIISEDKFLNYYLEKRDFRKNK